MRIKSSTVATIALLGLALSTPLALADSNTKLQSAGHDVLHVAEKNSPTCTSYLRQAKKLAALRDERKSLEKSLRSESDSSVSQQRQRTAEVVASVDHVLKTKWKNNIPDLTQNNQQLKRILAGIHNTEAAVTKFELSRVNKSIKKSEVVQSEVREKNKLNCW